MTTKNLNRKSIHSEKFKTWLEYIFRVFKIAEHEEAELITQINPFALAVLSTKYMNQTKGKSETEKRLQFKRKHIPPYFAITYLQGLCI